MHNYSTHKNNPSSCQISWHKRGEILSKDKKDTALRKKKEKSGKGYLNTAGLDCLAPQVQIFLVIQPLQIFISQREQTECCECNCD